MARRYFLQRHGRAEPTLTQPERQLTPAGQAELERAVVGLARAGLTLAAIVHSPLDRARQTAHVMRRLAGPQAVCLPCPHLAPGSAPEALVAWLEAQLAGDEPCLMVAHMPDVALWTALWSGQQAAAQEPYLPGSIARLDSPGPLGPGAARLAWHLPVDALGDLPPGLCAPRAGPLA